MPESGSWGLRWDAEFDCETTHQGDHDGLMRERAAPRVVCASTACRHVGLLNRGAGDSGVGLWPNHQRSQWSVRASCHIHHTTHPVHAREQTLYASRPCSLRAGI